MWVRDAKFFCEAVTCNFDRVYTDNLFSFHVEQLFSLCKKIYISLPCIWASQKYNSNVVSARVNRCMNVSLAKNSAEIIECYLEVLVRLLLSGLVHVGDSFLQMCKEFSHESDIKRKNLFLDYAIKGFKSFFNEYYRQLKVAIFLYMYKNFSPKSNYNPDSFKIINRHYLEFLTKKFDKK